MQEARIERDRSLREATEASKALVEQARSKSGEEASRIIENTRLAIETDKKADLT